MSKTKLLNDSEVAAPNQNPTEAKFIYKRKIALVITCADYAQLRRVMKTNAESRLNTMKEKRKLLLESDDDKAKMK